MLIYHSSSARRRDLYRTQPGNSDAAGTCSLCAEPRSWGGEAREEFFSFTCKSEHSNRRKDAETLGPCHCIIPSRGDTESCPDLSAGIRGTLPQRSPPSPGTILARPLISSVPGASPGDGAGDNASQPQLLPARTSLPRY